MRAGRAGHDFLGRERFVITRVGCLDGATRLEVDMSRPVHRYNIFGRNQLTRGAVDHIEEAVLRRLHNDLAVAAVDLEIGEHHVLHGRVIPGIAGDCLVVPRVLARVGVERNDGRQKQVVATAGASQ